MIERGCLALGLPLSTTYRYVRQLRDRGFVTELRGRYGPGPQMIALAGRHLTQAHLAAGPQAAREHDERVSSRHPARPEGARDHRAHAADAEGAVDVEPDRTW